MRKVEQQKGMEISETAKEELVVLLEHTFLLDELQIKAWDLQIEKVRSFQELLQCGMKKRLLVEMLDNAILEHNHRRNRQPRSFIIISPADGRHNL